MICFGAGCVSGALGYFVEVSIEGLSDRAKELRELRVGLVEEEGEAAAAADDDGTAGVAPPSAAAGPCARARRGERRVGDGRDVADDGRARGVARHRHGVGAARA